MKTFKVNADFTVNVSVEIEAHDEDEAKRISVSEILSKNCEWLDPIKEPKINWAELVDDDTDQLCYYCGHDGCDCDLI